MVDLCKRLGWSRKVGKPCQLKGEASRTGGIWDLNRTGHQHHDCDHLNYSHIIHNHHSYTITRHCHQGGSTRHGPASRARSGPASRSTSNYTKFSKVRISTTRQCHHPSHLYSQAPTPLDPCGPHCPTTPQLATLSDTSSTTTVTAVTTPLTSPTPLYQSPMASQAKLSAWQAALHTSHLQLAPVVSTILPLPNQNNPQHSKW